MNEVTLDDLGRKERLHPLYLLTGLGKVARNGWGLIAGGAFLAFQERWDIFVLLLLTMTGGTFVSLLIRWLTFEYRLGNDELRIDQGLLARSSRAIPFDRVTDVDIEQGPIHRLFGLARVRMETGAATKADAEEGVLDAVALDRAEAIREYVRARKRGLAPRPAEVIAHDAPALFEMSIKRVVTLGLFNFSLAILAALVGLSQTLGNVLNFDPFDPDFWADLFASSGAVRDFVMLYQVIAAIAGTILLVLVGMVTGLIRTLLRDYGFRLERTESGLRRRRGLVTLTDVTIPDRRIQAATLVTGPVRRRFGWFALKLQSLAMDDKQGDHVVAPLATFEEAATIQRSLSRPIEPDSAWHRLPYGHFTSGAIGLLVVMAVAIGVGILAEPLAFLAAAGVGLAIVVHHYEWKHARWALDDAHVFIERGWWRQRRAIVPVKRIQSVDLTENFWTRLFGFSRLRLGIAGGTLLDSFSIEAIARADAEALRARLVAA